MEETASEYRPALQAAFDAALEFLNRLDSMPVGARASLEGLRERFRIQLPERGDLPEHIVRDLVENATDGMSGSPTGRFFAWVIGGTLPAALAADWLTSTWDQNAAMFAPSPASAVIEEVAGSWLKELFGLPPESAFAFVTGGQMANTTCLAAARNSVLTKTGWDVETSGLAGVPPIHVLCPESRHNSVDRSVRFLGIGSGQMTRVACDREGRIIYDELKRALETHAGPKIVCLQAGDINTGAFDDFVRLIPLAKEHDAFVHVDGAFGLWAAATPTYRSFMLGADQADSWSVDGHKWLNVPYDCGYSFVRDAGALRNSMANTASYLSYSAAARDQMDWNPELSRRARGIPTYAALRQLGRQGIVDLSDRCCAHAKSLVMQAGKLPRVEVLHLPTLNQGLLRFHSQQPADEAADDAYTDRLIHAVWKSGEAFFSGTTWHGRRAMRVSVCNWRTSDSDVSRAVAAIAAALRSER
jgi:glutamate/tyrosine decarboxylase-like PLP-dependent enzyme